ncbi:MAG: HIT domain-containing protein [Deferribacteraceae bacterium]|jgi:ATP adenylyltransferase|nr:HIT domain-containing protein [Deferribacteraceae bacterium]
MRHIVWAPWRGTYITGEKPVSACVFCDIFKSPDDKNNYLLYRGNHTFIIMNLYPYNNGHLMIVPIRHTADILTLDKNEFEETTVLMRRSIKAIKETMSAEGFNVGYNLGSAAGAGIDAHIHLHIVPRWNGDTNFMPVISETKVISEHITDTYNKLAKFFCIMEGL